MACLLLFTIVVRDSAPGEELMASTMVLYVAAVQAFFARMGRYGLTNLLKWSSDRGPCRSRSSFPSGNKRTRMFRTAILLHLGAMPSSAIFYRPFFVAIFRVCLNYFETSGPRRNKPKTSKCTASPPDHTPPESRFFFSQPGPMHTVRSRGAVGGRKLWCCWS